MIASDLYSEADTHNSRLLLGLSELRGVGFATMCGLYDLCRRDFRQLQELPSEAIEKVLSQKHHQDAKRTARIIQDTFDKISQAGSERLARMNDHGHRLVFDYSPNFPQRLFDLSDAPRWLFIEGSLELLQAPRIAAVVGTREPTANGKESARRACVDLIKEGAVILSGLAEGIDESSHRVAVDLGLPTIAVLGHGLNIYFPSKTANLRQALVREGGCVLTEYLLGESYSRTKFVMRNRLQAALSDLLVVAEGREKSGTAHTIRFADKLRRPICGVSLDRSLSSPNQGVHRLIDSLGYPLFFLETSNGSHEEFREFLHGIYGSTPQSFSTESLHIFRSVLASIQALCERYDPKEPEFKWLIKELNKIRRNRYAHKGDSN